MALQQELRDLINLSHALAWKGAGESPSASNIPDEPGLVSAFLDESIQNQLEASLQNALGSSASVQVNSIFTHKTPLVTPEGRSAVEIGDLLLVRQHFVTTTDSVEGRALLLQAKRNKHPDSGDISEGKPQIQYLLYKDWPRFHGDGRLGHCPDPTPTGGVEQPWDFSLSNPLGRFGQYVAIFDGQAHPHPAVLPLAVPTAAFDASRYPPDGGKGTPRTTWACGQVQPTPAVTNIACKDDFAAVLEQFFLGTVGEHFTPGTVSGDDHWSRFVTTMLGAATQSSYTFLSSRTNVLKPTSRGAKINTLLGIQPLLKLAIMKEIDRHFRSAAFTASFDYDHEPHFFRRATERSEFVNHLAHIRQRLRRDLDIEYGGWLPPDDMPGPDRSGGGHVPILSIASSGPKPLLLEPREPRFRGD
ncbi:TPA: hypothetical protein ACKQBZ_000040 [Stenotrophomonas maltophilia]|uniref:hypothetical protein n=1 Tax=Stenotrophomonas forensis TaxID=2871169 RepID=UPI0018D3BD61|nr:hypothetical protein [Stenotrophomonas maltophilia]